MWWRSSCRRIATRYEKTARNYRTVVAPPTGEPFDECGDVARLQARAQPAAAPVVHFKPSLTQRRSQEEHWTPLIMMSCTRFLWTPICPRRDRNDDVQHEEHGSFSGR